MENNTPERVVVSTTGIEEPEKSGEPVAKEVFSSTRTQLRKNRRAASRLRSRRDRNKKNTARKSKKKNR